MIERFFGGAFRIFFGLIVLFVVVRHPSFVVGLLQEFINAAARVADAIPGLDLHTGNKGSN